MTVHLNRKQTVIYGPLSYGIHKKRACFVSDTHFIIQGNRICAGFRLKGISLDLLSPVTAVRKRGAHRGTDCPVSLLTRVSPNSPSGAFLNFFPLSHKPYFPLAARVNVPVSLL